MACSTGISLLTAGFVPSVFHLGVTGYNYQPVVSTGNNVARSITTEVSIINSPSDIDYGTLEGVGHVISGVTGNGLGSFSSYFTGSATNLTNILAFDLTHGAFAWRDFDVTITATSTSGATRTTGYSNIRVACNYAGTPCSYSTTALSSVNNVKEVYYNDPFTGNTVPDDLTFNGVTEFSYNINSGNAFTVDYYNGDVTVELKSDKLGSHTTSINHSAFDSWGLAGIVGANYTVTANRQLQWGSVQEGVISSYSKTSNGIGFLIQSDGDVRFEYESIDPYAGTFDFRSSWIWNDLVADILHGSFIQTPAFYQIKVSHVSGNTSWTFTRVGGSAYTVMNKDQWYDMSYNSAYPDFAVHLTSNNVAGVYTSVVNIQIRNMADTASYSQNVTLTLTDI